LLTPSEFWSVVSAAVRDYQAATPELAEAFAKYDIFAPSFALSCLNRLQLKNNQQMVDLTDVAGSLQFVGTLENPLGCG
jgi:siderophore synthetase component